jgi:toxin HigB-1
MLADSPNSKNPLFCCVLRNMSYNVYMIKSFKHKGLQRFFESGHAAGIKPTHKKKIKMRLVALDTASCIEDMDLPGFRLHPLKGRKPRTWAIDVNKNWRITFLFKDGDAYLINYEDYH